MFKTFFDIKIINVSILFCFMETLSYGINVDDVISQYEKNSYTTKINEINMKTYDIKDKALKNGDWKEYELELLRDRNDNVAIICTIENMDPMGIHTGDSITVAPAMTLSDRTFQRMRDMAIKMMRSIGDFAGGCNVQFAVSPDEKEDIIAIEINPRVSRSSALARGLLFRGCLRKSSG